MNLQVFKNSKIGAEVRSMKINNEPWFVAKDVCDTLGLTDTGKTVERLEDDEKLIRTLFVSGQNRQLWMVNESGLYSLIFQSRKPEAKKFRKWVTSEVLPAIRKTGGYSALRYVPQSHAELLNDFSNTMYRELMKVENNRVRVRLAGILDFYLIQAQTLNHKGRIG